MDRTRLQELGLNPTDVAQNMLALDCRQPRRPRRAFWLNPANGIVYNVAVQTPQYAIDGLDVAAAYAGARDAGERRVGGRRAAGA